LLWAKERERERERPSSEMKSRKKKSSKFLLSNKIIYDFSLFFLE
jgi:hypothetical protein